MDLLEPHRSRFVELVRHGAGAQDIHHVAGRRHDAPTEADRPSDAFIAREIQRVNLHLQRLVPLLEANCFLIDKVLDVGCSTGGTTCAIALSERFRTADVVGVDPSDLSIQAAKVRAAGLGLADRLRFETIDAGAALPFPDGAFDLVVAVSVLEFVPREQRARFLAELERVTRIGGCVYLATPHVARLKEVHSRRWFGNLRRSPDHPWASSGWSIRRSLRRCSTVPLLPPAAVRASRRLGLRGVPWSLRVAATLVMNMGAWKKMLFRRQA